MTYDINVMPTVADYAKADLRAGILEKPSKSNRAPRIDAVLKFFNIKGVAWCAAILSAWFRSCVAVGGKHEFPYSPSSQYIMRWFKERDLLTFCATQTLHWTAVAAGWTNADDAGHGHIFLVISRYTENGKVTGIQTIEGNTDKVGDRLGDGCYSLRRDLCPDGLWRVRSVDGELVGSGKKLWFLNCTDMPGAGYLSAT
jgi:hypothetical protein